MALTPDEIKSIEQVATSLKRWADNLSYEYSPTLIRIGPRLGQDKVALWLLREMPAVGKKVEKDFNVLDEIIGEINSWCGKTITEDELVEFDNLVDTLKGAAYELVETLRDIAKIARKERKRRIVKGIFYLIGVLAALLTCISLIWWLCTKFSA